MENFELTGIIQNAITGDLDYFSSALELANKLCVLVNTHEVGTLERFNISFKLTPENFSKKLN